VVAAMFKITTLSIIWYIISSFKKSQKYEIASSSYKKITNKITIIINLIISINILKKIKK
jgi:hypothetical protein